MSKITRRSFIQKAATTAAACAAVPGTILGKSALAGNMETSASTSALGTNKKVIGRGTEMKIIHFTDTHLRGDNLLSFGKCDTTATVKQAMEYFNSLPEHKLPDVFIATGDLADNGNLEAYKKVRDYFSGLPRPVYCVPGNHDHREDMYNILGHSLCPIEKGMEPYFCYSIEDTPIRIICVDTIIEGKHWGGLSEKVADWLEKKLDEKPNKKTLIFTHHPPFDAGMGFMDEGFENLERFAEILVKHKDHIQLCCGHMHRSIATKWRGVPITVAGPVCMLMELDFREEGGDAFYLGDPEFLTYHLYHNIINTHACIIPTGASYAGPYPFKYLDVDLKKK